ncbi:hypothetical protein E3P84_00094 [Wallemia ichthyophaga]|nr:hypothetical protein E3P84_00094 [Wallemia ichthyophaga]TIB44684.1 hypothetical protein E3P83_00094 [Wallemia ichthyophaga]
MINRVQQLRRNLTQQNIHAFFVPSEDAHSSEYIADADKRREWISNFSGSAGDALITEKEALLTTDGRYHLQATQQLDSSTYKLLKAGVPGVPAWYDYLMQHYTPPFRIGVDPKLVAFSQVCKIQDKLKAKPGFDLVAVGSNPIDEIAELPGYPNSEVYVQPLTYAGRSVSDKLNDLRGYLNKENAHAFIVTTLDETAWLLNLRGSDIVYNPLFFSYAIVTANACTLYVDSGRMTQEAIDQMRSAAVELKPYADFYPSLPPLSCDAEDAQRKVLVSDKANWEVVRAVREEHVRVARSPVGEAKAVKNQVELQGARAAHARDGVALTQYFAWLEEGLHDGHTVKEHDAALVLEQYRSSLDLFRGLSFNTISATGANGAVIHYSPSETDSAVIDVEKVYLCDSGAQFLDGTTDVTRTYFFGRTNPGEKLKRAFTRVLQGHIALASAVIPNDKVPGAFIDAIARMPLWREGLEYMHGTGHGIGSHLGAHEGPHSISPRFNDTTLKQGYLVSNEPGYYEAGTFGIRTEAILAIVPYKAPNSTDETQFAGFETLTLCPIGTNLIEVELLSQGEKEWLNEYHERCLKTLKPELEKRGDERAIRWLERNDEAVEDILDGTSYAVLYSFVEGVGWRKEMVEGSMFIFTRSVMPRYGLFILNRSGPDNFITLFTGTDDLQLTGDYIIFRPADEDAIWGVWVFDATHRPRISKCIEKIERLAAKEKSSTKPKQDSLVDPAIASISHSPASAQDKGNHENIEQQPGQPLSVDDLFGNFDSPALSAANAAPAPSTLPSVSHKWGKLQQSQPTPSQYEDVKVDGTQQLLSFLGLPPTATVDGSNGVSVSSVPSVPNMSSMPNMQQQQQQQHSQQPQYVLHSTNNQPPPQMGMYGQTLPPLSPFSPAVHPSHTPHTTHSTHTPPLSIPIDARVPQQPAHMHTPHIQPSVPPTPLPFSAVTPSATPSEPRHPIVLNDELESLKKLTFEEKGGEFEAEREKERERKGEKERETEKEEKQKQQSSQADTTAPRNHQFNRNFPPLGISPPTAPRAERERQQKMMEMQQQQNDDLKPSPGLFNPGIRTQVRTVPKTRKPSAIGGMGIIQRPSVIESQGSGEAGNIGKVGQAQVPQVPQLQQMQQLPPSPQMPQVSQAPQQPQVQPPQHIQHLYAQPSPHTKPPQHTPEVARISPQVGLDVMTPTLTLLRHPSGHKLDERGFKQALASLILENDEFLSILYQRYITC